jgi:hypothetical protein
MIVCPNLPSCPPFADFLLVYNDLPHPPSTYLAPYPLQVTHPCAPPHGNVKYAYRTADGSFNNPLVPTLGQAGTPYACSVPSANFSPKRALLELSTQAVGVIHTV